MVAPICSSVQLLFIYLNLSTILVPSGRFSCRSQVSYHIFVFFTSLLEQGPQGWPNVSYLRVLETANLILHLDGITSIPQYYVMTCISNTSNDSHFGTGYNNLLGTQVQWSKSKCYIYSC